MRIGITLLYLKSCRVNYGFDGRKYPVKLHLRPSNPQLTPPTLQIQYCYSIIAWKIYEIKYRTNVNNQRPNKIDIYPEHKVSRYFSMPGSPQISHNISILSLFRCSWKIALRGKNANNPTNVSNGFIYK